MIMSMSKKSEIGGRNSGRQGGAIVPGASGSSTSEGPAERLSTGLSVEDVTVDRIASESNIGELITGPPTDGVTIVKSSEARDSSVAAGGGDRDRGGETDLDDSAESMDTMIEEEGWGSENFYTPNTKSKGKRKRSSPIDYVVIEDDTSEDEIRGARPKNSRRRFVSPAAPTSGGGMSLRSGMSKALSPKNKGLGYRRNELENSNIEDSIVKESESQSSPLSGAAMREKLESRSSKTIEKSAIKCLKNLDAIRIKSKKLQGILSGIMKQDFEYLKVVVQVLAARTEAKGDPQFLRSHNAELEAQLRASISEEIRLKEDIGLRDKKIKDLHSEISSLKERMGSGPSSSEVGGERGSYGEQRGKRGSKRVVGARRATGTNREDGESKAESRLNADGSPTAVDLKRRMDAFMRIDENFMDQLKVLCEQSKQTAGRSSSADGGKDGRERERHGTTGKGRGARPSDEGTGTDGDKWTLVSKRGKDRRNARVEPRDLYGRRPKEKEKEGVQRPRTDRPPGVDPRSMNRRRRPPPMAAVSLRRSEEGTTYAEILRRARNEVSLNELGIENPKIRRAMNGGLIIEIPGDDGASKADNLAERLRTVIGGVAVVARPKAKAEALLIGLDESVTPAEVTSIVAKIGGSNEGDIKVGPIRPMANGLSTIWIQGPVEVINRVTETQRVTIGWSVVKVVALRSKPMQCYKCWRLGHARGTCKATVDRGQSCFRCGQDGHQSRECRKPFHCTLCAEDGKDSAHRIGTLGCINSLGIRR